LKNLILDHELTPPQLQDINQAILELVTEESVNEAELLRLVSLRDDTIQNYLKDCNEETRKAFAEAELQVNGLLIAYANKLFNASLKQLSGLIRGRKAVKKYI
jgi:hypothetical protein